MGVEEGSISAVVVEVDAVVVCGLVTRHPWVAHTVGLVVVMAIPLEEMAVAVEAIEEDVVTMARCVEEAAISVVV